MLKQAKLSRRVFCEKVACCATALVFLSCAELFAGCNTENKPTQSHPPIQINNTNVLSNTRYIGDAFAFPEQIVSALLVPGLNRLPPYAQGVSFVGVIAQDTISPGYDPTRPHDIALVGMFKQQNGTFRYGYEVNSIRHYARGHVSGLDYNYNIEFHLNEQGMVTDPAYPHQRRFGYLLQILNGLDDSQRIQGLQSSSIYANQIFVGVMDDNNNVRLPNKQQLQLSIAVSDQEKAPNILYRNEDDTSEVSSQFDEIQNRIILTFTGSY